MNPILALIIANLIWGAASPIFKFALENIPPFTLAFVRFFCATLVMFPFVNLKETKQLTKRNWFDIIIGAAFLGIIVNISFFFLGLQRSDSINAPIIASSGPIFLFLFSIIFLREKFNQRIFIGMLIAFFGVLIIVLMPLLVSGLNFNDLMKLEGNLFFVIATLGSVLSTLMMKNVLKQISPMLVTVLSFFFSCFGFLPLMIKELKTWNFSQINGAGIIGVFYGVFFSSAFAYFLYSYGLSKIKAQEVGLFTYIDPIVAIVIAVPLLGEYPKIEFIIGSLLVFLGILIAENRIHYHPLHKILKSTL